VRLAKMDLATARHMFETYHPIPLEIVCFHSQQAAEKMLKCFLTSHDIVFPKTHDMQVICEMCADIDERFNEIYKQSVLLTRYSVIVRYPAELGLEEKDAISAIEHAEAVTDFVTRLLSEKDDSQNTSVNIEG